jgi:hydroxyethylthiazole kinase-like uncharacterized protein yjeF
LAWENGWTTFGDADLADREVGLSKIVTVGQMQEIERAVDAAGLTYAQMMENAGKVVADATLERWPELKEGRVLILVGPGNNGGDGLVAAHHLMQAGVEVGIYLTKARTNDDDNFERVKDRASPLAVAEHDQRLRVLRGAVGNCDVLIDAVLGTGMKLPLEGTARKVLGAVQSELEKLHSKPAVVAVDCPSGMDCDSGEIAPEALRADMTITLAAAKTGLLRFPGAERVGDLLVGDIGIAPDQEQLQRVDLDLADPVLLQPWLPERPRASHKGTFGWALIVAGSVNYPGAVALAGMGAYRCGAGLVTLAVPAPIQGWIVPILPEATWLVLPHEMGVIDETAVAILMESISDYQALLIGPGFGRDEATKTFLEELLGLRLGRERGQIGFVGLEAGSKPERHALPTCVVDADGLKLLRKIPDWPNLLPPSSVLTPHPGEMAYLTDQAKEDLQQDRVASARNWASKWGHVVLLKGANSVVAAPDGHTTVIPIATSALASAGTGDVLAGMIVGFMAQGLDSYQAAVMGAYLHGRAGMLAKDYIGVEASVVAGDVVDAIPGAIADLRARTKRI